MRQLDLKTLQLFVAVCEDGTLTGAARRESIAPSALSKRLVEMERTLGIKLLHRRATGMAVTPAGETLLHHARLMLTNADNISMELAEHAKGVRGFVRMLANLSAIVEFLPEDLQSFLTAQPAIRIELEERPSLHVVTGIRDGAADLGICAGDTPTYDLESRPYRHDQLVIVMPAAIRCPGARLSRSLKRSTTIMSGSMSRVRSTAASVPRRSASGPAAPPRPCAELRRNLPNGTGEHGPRRRPRAGLRPAWSADASDRRAAD